MFFEALPILNSVHSVLEVFVAASAAATVAVAATGGVAAAVACD